MKKTLKIVSNTLVAVAVLLVCLLHGPRLFGLTPYCVLSGSMQSVYPIGSLIYVADVLPEQLEVGDIITFRLSGGTVVTHRIVQRFPDESNPDVIRFQTKGDENPIADGTLVAYDDVIGKPLFGIPLLGYLAAYISQPPGKYVAITVAIALILMEAMMGIVLESKPKKNP